MDKTAIFQSLQDRIIRMDLEPGQPVQEKALMEEFGVSRTPIREALIKLEQRGLIDIKPRVGTFVSQIDVRAVKDAFEVKKDLEGLASELAAHRASPAQIQELYQIIESFKTLDIEKDYQECIAADQHFHYIIREAAGNETLKEILESLNIKTARFLQSIRYVITDYAWFSRSLQDIAHAIKNKDSQGARVYTELHTKEFLNQMSKHFFHV